MKATANFEQSYHRAVQIAAQLRHEFLTPEHLLLSLLDDPDATKVLKGAGADIDTLKVKTVYVERGMFLKRFHPRAKGRGFRVQKASCHIYLTVGD